MKRGRLAFVSKQIQAALRQGREVRYHGTRIDGVKIVGQTLLVRDPATDDWYAVLSWHHLLMQVCPPGEAPTGR